MRIHKEGYRIIAYSFIIIGIILGLILYFNSYTVSSIICCIIGIAVFLLITNFFRSPNRSPKIDDDSVIAAADGTIVIIDKVYEPEYLKSECIQVSIFMSILNVHVNWFHLCAPRSPTPETACHADYSSPSPTGDTPVQWPGTPAGALDLP